MAFDSTDVIIDASYFSEICSDSCLVANTQFPSAINLGDIRLITQQHITDIVKKWPDRYWLLTGGPPCQDVSLLNSDGCGSWGDRSGLREEFRRIYNWFCTAVPSERLFAIMECTKMLPEDQVAYDEVFHRGPVEICSAFAVPMTRPRLWWVNKGVHWHKFAEVDESGYNPIIRPASIRQPMESYLEPGWVPAAPNADSPQFTFRCLTRSTPRKRPMKDPRGISRCKPADLARWKADLWAQAPYQYRVNNLVKSKKGNMRRLLAVEEERMMGFPAHYTSPLLQVRMQDHLYEHKRKSLLGNAWNVFVVLFILQCMGIVVPASATTTVTEEAHFLDTPDFRELPLKTYQAVANTLDQYQRLFPVPGLNVPFTTTIPAPVPTWLGPDMAEQWAAQTCSTITGFQSKHFGFGASRQKLIHAGLSPPMHCQMACNLQSPLDRLPPLADDLKFACSTLLRPDYDEWVIRQRRIFRGVLRKALPFAVGLQGLKTDTALTTCAGVDPSIVLLLTYLMQWPDRSLMLLSMRGAAVVGDIPTADIFRLQETTASMSLNEWLDTADEWNVAITKRPPPNAEQATAVWEASRQEQLEGTLGRWYTYDELNNLHGKGKWRAMVRFGVQQGVKWRCIDNGRTGCHNETVSSTDKIHTTSIDVAMAISAFIAQHPDGKNRKQLRATRDMRKAYRQIPIVPGQEAFQIIAVWHPDIRRYVFAHLKGLAFGLVASVAHFNRIPAFLIAVARRFFAIPAISYFDDIRLHAVEPHGTLVWETFNWMIETIGYVFDPSKDSPMADSGMFLGFKEDLSTVHLDGTARIFPKEEFLAGVEHSIVQALESGVLQHGEARALRGRLLHLSNCMTGRVGRGQTFAFETLLQSESVQIPPDLRICLTFFLDLIALQPWRTFVFSARGIADGVIYTDAAAQGDGGDQMVTLSFVYISGECKKAGRTVLSRDILQSFQDRSTYIAHGEAMACLFCLYHMRKWLRGQSVVHFIDNLGVLSAFCRGSSKVCDIAHIVTATLTLETTLQMKSWKEHVDSQANLADCGTKDTFDHVQALGIPWENLEMPPWPSKVATASAAEWLQWFHIGKTT